MSEKIEVGDKVISLTHEDYGVGTVLGVSEPGVYDVRFENYGGYDDTNPVSKGKYGKDYHIVVEREIRKRTLAEKRAEDEAEITAAADELEERINPTYYQFPGGVEVRDISTYLTGNGAQALQYVARSCRLDGNNKGNPVENLKKAIQFIYWEIDRLESDAAEG